MSNNRKRWQRGEGIVSYIIVLVVIVLGCIVGAQALKTAINDTATAAGNKLKSQPELQSGAPSSGKTGGGTNTQRK